VELVLVADPLRAATLKSDGTEPDGLHPKLLTGDDGKDVLNCIGATGLMMLRPRGVIDPRRG